MKEKNLETVYQEITEILSQQQASVDLLYNKFNWILVSDLVFLAALYNTHRPNVLVVLLVSLSGILCLVGFQPKVFKMTAKISAQLDKVDESNFLESLIDKKKEAFTANDSRVDEMKNLMSWSRWLLISAIAVQLSVLLIYSAYVGQG